MSLDFSPQQLKKLICESADIINQWYEKRLRNERIYQNPSPAEIQSVFNQPLPRYSTDPEVILDKVKKEVFDRSNFNPSPNYYGYITGGGNQMGMVAELLKAALNQNNLKWHSAPVNSELEKIVIQWLCEFIGYPTDAGGVLVSGGSVANFLNLAVMRKIKCPVDVAEEGMYAAPAMTIYVSEQGHSSIDKAVDMLGIGKKISQKNRRG